MTSNQTGLEIAVIGMAGRFPGAKNTREFWNNLVNGVESITFFTDAELEEAGIEKKLLTNPHYVKAKGMLSQIEYFDADFFGYSPKDAQMLEPQIRIFSECVWEALEDAGYDPFTYQGSIGLYASATGNYFWEVLTLSSNTIQSAEQFANIQMFDRFITTRISYNLNLKGPSIFLTTACSSSLVTVHIACRALLAGECNIALAGGVSIALPQKSGYLYQEGMIMSPDGHCRAFDAEAKGTIWGEGAGVVVLKMLKQAIADGDHLYAVIKGTALNNDGDRKVGYTAPSIDGQAEVVRMAQRISRVEPESIGYVETHGTGTVLGDPIEVEALKTAFHTDKKQFCRIGSVKTNIGHLDIAAGVAGLIKTVLALKHKQIPPSLHYQTPNPKIEFHNSPFVVNTQLIDWRNDSYPLRAGVSSFGIGGTNAHVVLEEAPELESAPKTRPWQLVLVSAKTETALAKICANLVEDIQSNPDMDLADLAYTLAVGRTHFPYRRMAICKDAGDAVAFLTKQDNISLVIDENPNLILMFPGQGSRYLKMGRELFETEPLIRDEMNRCGKILQSISNFDLNGILDPVNQENHQVYGPVITQAVVFSVEYVLAKLLMAWGLKPQGMIGDGIGEYVAACLTGAFSLEDTLSLVTSEAATSLEYQAHRIPKTIRFADGLNRLLEKGRATLLEVGGGCALTGLVREHPSYRAEDHLLLNSLKDPQETIVEVDDLVTLIGRLWRQGIVVDWKGFYGTQGRRRISLPTYPFERKYFWIEGNPLALLKTPSEAIPGPIVKKNRVQEWYYLPSWERNPLITHSSQNKMNSLRCLVFLGDHPLSSKLVDWLQVNKMDLMIIRQESGLKEITPNVYEVDPENEADYQALFQELHRKDHFPQLIIHLWSITDHNTPVLENISGEIQTSGFYSLLYMAKAIGKENGKDGLAIFVISNNTQVLTGEETIIAGKATLSGACKVISQEFPRITCRYIDLSLPEPGSRSESWLLDNLGKELLSDSVEPMIAYRGSQRWVQIFKPVQFKNFENTGELLTKKPARFREKGTYLITGGFGKMGMLIARNLAETLKAKIILIGRSRIPDRTGWDAYLAADDHNETICRKIVQIKELEALGAEVLLFSSDLSNYQQLKEIVGQAEEKFGSINGIFHAAGIMDGKIITEITIADCKKYFQAKIDGLLTLYQVFQDKELDFCLLMSSIAAILGGIGYVAYAAANLFMDAFVQQIGATNKAHWFSINWDLWRFDGSERGQNSFGAELANLAITPEEGIEVLYQVLDFEGINQVVISTGDLQARIDRWLKPAEVKRFGKAGKSKKLPLHERLASTQPYNAPQNEIEVKLAEIWQEVMGFERIGVNEDFFEMGGDSLKAIILKNRVGEVFGIEINTSELFSVSTIIEMAEFIRQNAEVSDAANWIKDFKGNIGFQIEAAPAREYYPVSSGQKRILMLDQLGGAGTSYNIPGATMLQGKLERDRLEQAFWRLIQRHESFRTSFMMIEGNPAQQIHSEVEFRIEYTELAEPEDSGEPRRIAHAFIRPFDLRAAPLIRVGLVKIKEERYLLIFDMHHIISDGSSIGILVRELFDLYEGREPAALRIQYKDYAVWQNQLREAGSIKTREEYWLKRFAGEIPVLNLPTDYPRTSERSFAGDSISFQTGKKILAGLKTITQQTGATLYMTLLAAYNILLYKYTDQTDIVVGSIISGRNRPEVENLIGMFVNTLPLRNYPEGMKTFREFLNEVKENALDAYKNQDYQFEELVNELDLARDLGRNPLFDTVFVFQNTGMPELKMANLTISPYAFEYKTTKFDITIHIFERPTGLDFNLEYCARLFKRETMERLAGHYLNILAQVTVTADRWLAEIDILTEAERDWVLRDYNGTTVKYSGSKTLVGLFQEQAEKTPDESAALFETQRLSYRELDHRSNQVARYLQEQGIKPGEIIGVLVQRCPETLVNLLGILKAGAAYVPVEPEYPLERREYILRHSNCRMLLEPDIYRGKGLAAYPDDKVKETIGPEAIAYIIYTSGSTGNPKGVVITHHAVVNTIIDINRKFEVTATDRHLGLSSLCFDLSVYDVFGAFSAGSTLVQIPDQRDVKCLIQTMAEQRITIWNSVPAIMEMMVDNVTSNYRNESLRLVMLSGDWIPLGLPVKIKKHFPNAAVISLGGATEASIWSIYYPVTEIQSEWRSIPYGKPLANQQMYVLNGDGQICPVGIRGELHIGGRGLAEGYYNDDQKTEAAFIRHSTLGNLYRTGDYGVFRAEGYIEFLGRKDSQVKIRGYRIELGEIEARLLEHQQVKEAVVVVHGNESGNKYLCAYLTGSGELSTGELKAFLSDRLPEYMIPAFLVKLETLPLTANGKIDRKGLPEPVTGENTGMEYEAPRNKMEEDLAAIWREILEVDRIGIHNNFFELGGHSLKAATLVARLHQKFNVELPLREVFKTPTIYQLASFINEAGLNLHQSIQPAAERDFYPLSPAQKRLYFLYRLDESLTSYNIPGVILIEGNLDRVKLQTAVTKVIKRHETLRTSFPLVNGEPVQQVHQDTHFTLTYRSLDQAPGVELDAQIQNILPAMIREFITPFDLSKAPLLRISLVKYQNKKYILMFDMHHIISDAVSMEIIVDEIISLYNGVDLPELKIQYKDYSVWRNELLAKEKLRKQEEYWLGRFSDQIPVLLLNTDYPRPLIQSFEGAKWRFTTGRDLTQALTRLSTEVGVTIYMVLLGAFTIMLSKYTGQEDIVIGSPTAGRTHTDLENIIGMFINMLPMRNFPQGEQTCEQFLTNVKESALAAYENQDYQFEQLLDRLNIKRDLGRNPLFDVVFVLQNGGRGRNPETSFKITPYEFEQGISKFDLTLSAMEFEGTIQFYLEYCAKLFTIGTIERMAGHLINVLRQMIKNPREKLLNFDILSEVEKREILNDFNQTEAVYPKDKVIQQLFEAQVDKTPTRVAVCYQDRKLTYQELNQKANHLAGVLREKGVKPDNIVGMILDRSLEMVIAILGILKAGGAYLPISPDYPSERIIFMVNDSGMKILVTQTVHLEDVAAELAKRVEVIDFNKDCLDQGERSNLPITNQPGDLAYIIYTSGTTGQPKGSLIEHRNVVRLLFNDKFLFDFNENDVWTMFHSYCFDFSVWEMYGALLYGGKLVIIPAGTARDAGNYSEVLKTEKVTVVNQTPTAFYNLAAESSRQPGNELAGIRYIILGGEALQPLKLKEWHEKYPGTKLINMYGITETTVHVTYKEITENEITSNISNIGKPLPTLATYILDRYLKLLPVGATGELYVGGDGVGRGYLERPELTAAKFIENPFQPGERLYRSGDLAKFLPGGEIEYLGRIDNQVKIRGFRIEISEIETYLLKQGSIQEVTIVSKTDGTGNKFLCAYYTAVRALTVAELRGYLAQKLPDYMIPSFFIQLEAIPLTVNGKINKAALPEPVSMVLNTGEYLAPETDVEKELVSIWQKVLRIERISVNDNFFEIGGDSIRLMKVYADLKNRYAGKITMVDLFTHSTLKKLAEYLSKTADDQLKQLISLQPLTIPADYFHESHDNYPEGGFQFVLPGTTFAGITEFSLKEKVDNSEALLTVFIYLLAQISEQHQVTVQTIIGELDKIIPIEADLNSVNDFRGLVELVCRKHKMAAKEIIYQIDDLKYLQINKDELSIIPCFCKKELVSTRIGLKSIYDIVFEMNEADDETIIYCHYNESRLKKEKIKKFASDYLKLIKLLTK